MFTLILSIHARLYLDPKDREMTQLESPNGIDNKLVSKLYIFAETNPKSNSNDLQAPPPAPAPTIEPFRKHNDKDKKKKIISWVLPLSAAIIVVVAIVVVAVRRKKMPLKRMSMFDPFREADEVFAWLKFRLEDVSSLEIIGRGGSGVVYKAKMPDLRTVAIKKIVRPIEGGSELVGGDTTTSSLNYTSSVNYTRSINNNTRSLNTKQGQVRSEILTVGKMRHRNILPLLCHVSRPDCDYLVTEFMKNGSLQDLLQKVQEGRREFDWLARHSVALGVAQGLEYMHMNFYSRIVHRDLKPANILLGNDMEAKIADFGIAKSIPDTETHVTSSKLAGSFGYIAPEYYQTMKFDEKCDIYSFGVVLAVLVMGKLPSDEFFRRSEFSLLKWMRNVLIGEDPKQAIDPKMLGNGYEDHMLLVLRLACSCTLDNPQERPTSRDAAILLYDMSNENKKFTKLYSHNDLTTKYRCDGATREFLCSFIMVEGDKPPKDKGQSSGSEGTVGYPPNFKKRNGSNQGGSSNAAIPGTKDQPSVSSNTFTDEQYKRLTTLISEKSGSGSIPANVADVSKLNMTLGHPNGTKDVVTHIGSLRLTDKITINDVLVVRDYQDSILRTPSRDW
ncbi:leucine-rich repeat receptor-like serine/threonine/tyrosine-protein kinase SOBIR1 [Tanacetum coccineum]